MNKSHIEFKSKYGFIASLCRKNMQYVEPRTVLSADGFAKTPKQYKCKICTKILQRELQESETLASYTELEDKVKELRRERNLMRNNFEWYFKRFLAVTGKSIDEAEAEWEKREQPAFDKLRDENKRLREQNNNIGCKEIHGAEIKDGHIVHWTDGGDDLSLEERIKTRWDRIAVVSRDPAIKFTVIDSPCEKTKAYGHTFNFGTFIWTDTAKYLTIVAENVEDYHRKFKNAGECMAYVEALKGGA